MQFFSLKKKNPAYGKNLVSRFARNKIFIVILVLVLIFSLNFFQSETKRVFHSLFSPFQSFAWNIGHKISSPLSSVFQASNLAQENSNLKAENLALAQKIASFKGIELENKQLREAMSLGIDKDFDVVLVRVIGKDVSEDILFLNKGENEGIQKGMPVITQSKVAVGGIVQVFATTSKLRLLSHPDSSPDAKIEGQGIVGVLRGKGRNRATLDLISQEKDFQIGQMVLTTSLGGVFPENLLIGEIKTAKTSDVQAFQQAEVGLFFNIRESNILFVIMNK